MRKFLIILMIFVSFLIGGCGGNIIVNLPPDQPSNPNPQDGSTDVPVTLTLSWSCSDPDGDTLTYDVYFGTTSNPPLVVSDLSVNSYNPGTLQYDTTYYWKIVAKDPNGAETSGPVWSFTTIAYTGSLSLLGSYDIDSNDPGQIYSSAVFNTDNNIYIGGPNGLYRFNGFYTENITPDSSEIRAGPIMFNGKIYAGNLNGELIIYNFGYISVPISPLAFLSSPVFMNGYLYIIDHVGNMYKFDQYGNYISMPFSTCENVNSALAGDGNVIYIATTNGNIYAFNAITEQVDWYYPTNDNFNGGFAIDIDGNLYIAGNKIWSFYPNGNIRWQYDLNSKAVVNPIIGYGKVIIGTESGILYCFSTSGMLIWTKNLLYPILSSGVIGDNGILYIVSGTTLYAVSINSGFIIDQLEIGTYVESNLLLHDEKLYFAGNDGELYVIQAFSGSPYGDWPMFQKDVYRSGVR